MISWFSNRKKLIKLRSELDALTVVADKAIAGLTQERDRLANEIAELECRCVDYELEVSTLREHIKGYQEGTR